MPCPLQLSPSTAVWSGLAPSWFAPPPPLRDILFVDSREVLSGTEWSQDVPRTCRKAEAEGCAPCRAPGFPFLLGCVRWQPGFEDLLRVVPDRPLGRCVLRCELWRGLAFLVQKAHPPLVLTEGKQPLDQQLATLLLVPPTAALQGPDDTWG